MIRLSLLATSAIFALGISSDASAGGRPDLVKRDLQSGKQYAAGQMIIQYRSFATEKDKQRVQKALGGSRDSVLGRKGGRLNRSGDLELVRFAPGTSMQSKLDAILNDPAVDYAEPNWLVRHDATSNDPAFVNNQLWGMYGGSSTPANQFGSGAATAWLKNANCGNVIVGIIDEGYMYSHEDLAANAFINPKDSTFDGVDNDGNGLVDDVYGWDFANNDSSVFDGTMDDHGTHVAGTIGGVGGNGVGVAGVCHQVKLMGAKFLGAQGGTTANAIKAVDYFTDLKLSQGLNIVATNNSWGGGGYNQALRDAIERAKNANILFIASAGNAGTNNETSPSYPGSYDNTNIIAVTALQSNGSQIYNYGVTRVDICAPGYGIVSTVPVMVGKGRKAELGSGYASYNGTSMASPHVAGAAALYKANNPGATADMIKNAIMTSSTPTTSCASKVVSKGRLNVSGF
jgi:subtilisin family serine protease